MTSGTMNLKKALEEAGYYEAMSQSLWNWASDATGLESQLMQMLKKMADEEGITISEFYKDLPSYVLGYRRGFQDMLDFNDRYNALSLEYTVTVNNIIVS